MKKITILLLLSTVLLSTLSLGCGKEKSQVSITDTEIIEDTVSIDKTESIVFEHNNESNAEPPKENISQIEEPQPGPAPTQSEDKNEETTEKTEENIKILNIDNEVNEYGPILDSILLAMYEGKTEYSTNPDFIWTGLYYFVVNYADKYDYLKLRDDYSVEVKKETVKELINKIYGVDDVPEIPKDLGMIQKEEDKYLFMPSDRSLTSSYIEEYKPTDKNLKIVMELYSDEENSKLTTCEFVLVKNKFSANTIYDYYYNIQSAQLK